MRDEIKQTTFVDDRKCSTWNRLSNKFKEKITFPGPAAHVCLGLNANTDTRTQTV